MGITEIFLNYYQYFLRGTQTTVIVSLITVLLGTVLGCLIALLRLSRFRLCSGFAKLYITVIRGTPLLVQLYIVYYQLHFIPWPEGSILGVELARVMPCILALSMNSTAYVAEVIRSGIQAVDGGQMEAARGDHLIFVEGGADPLEDLQLVEFFLQVHNLQNFTLIFHGTASFPPETPPGR